ncbi:MAG: ATP-binding protein [Chloroflexota bacterium]
MTEQADAEADGADTLPVDILQQIVQGAGYGVYCIDLAGRTTYLNAAAAALLGYSPEALLGRSMHAAIHHTQADGRPHSQTDCPIYQTARDGVRQRTDAELFWRQDGTNFPVEYVSMPLQRGGRVVGAAVTFQDISARRRAEEARAQAIRTQAARADATSAENARLYVEAQQAVRARDEFLSMAAHELRTPVTALRGFAQLALRQLRRGRFDLEHGRLYLEEIDEQTVTLTNLVSELLDISRLDIGTLVIQRESIDLAAIVTAVVCAARQRNAEHEVTVQSPMALPAALDRARIEQVLTNLIDNAMKFSPGGGAIEVDVAPLPPNSAEIAVRDHGIGIPVEEQGHVFDRFYQAHAGDSYWGLGLGLHVARQIAELHGGVLTVDSPPGGGSRFTLRLPLQADNGSAGAVEESRHPTRSTGAERVAATTVARSLSKAG